MAQTMDGSESQTDRANDLYWSGSMTVDEIVEELGISRTTLYSSIEPMPSGLICADCHERMVYPNRTSRDRGVAVCPNCGRESEPGEAGAAGAAAAAPQGAGAGEGEPIGGSDPFTGWRDTLRSVPPQRLALVGGGAALGLLVGALATGLLREGF